MNNGYEQWQWKEEKKQQDNELTCHTLIAGNVLCRYWQDVEKGKEAKLIENAQKLYDSLKKLREWHKSEYQSNRVIDKEVDELLELIDKD